MKARRIVTGLVLMIASVVFAVVATIVWTAAEDQARLNELAYQRADVGCREQIKKLGGTIAETRGGDIWDVRVPVPAAAPSEQQSMPPSMRALSAGSVIVANCQTRTMESFCLGAGCLERAAAQVAQYGQRPAVSMTMRLSLRPGLTAASPATTPPTSSPTPPQPKATQHQAKPAQQPARPMPARPAAPNPSGNAR